MRDIENRCMTTAQARMSDAAPRMLEALQLVNDVYYAVQKHPSVVQEAHCMNVVRDAIARATGRPA
jgi:hypothetical protein